MRHIESGIIVRFIFIVHHSLGLSSLRVFGVVLQTWKVLLIGENRTCLEFCSPSSRSTFRVKTTGSYPRLHVDTAEVAAVGHAGGVMLTETIRAAGLDRGLSERLARWRKPLAVHDPAKIVLDLAIMLVLGGDAMSDLATLRAEPGAYGRVASDPTVSRMIAVLASDVDRVLAAISAARQEARAIAWAFAGDDAPGAAVSVDQPLVIDLDATLITAHSEKEDAKPTFKRGFGFHPLCAFADHGGSVERWLCDQELSHSLPVPTPRATSAAFTVGLASLEEQP